MRYDYNDEHTKCNYIMDTLINNYTYIIYIFMLFVLLHNTVYMSCNIYIVLVVITTLRNKLSDGFVGNKVH